MIMTLFVPLATLLLGHALIATEFRQKTQLFLEGLPLPRWKMLAVKHAFGLLLIVCGVLAIFGAAWWSSKGREAMTPQFAGILLVKMLGWSWFCYSFCFAHAFLGRYRTIFALALFFGLAFAEGKGVPVDSFGPFHLMDHRFPYERNVWPLQSLWVDAALIVGFTSLGFLLGLIRDATLGDVAGRKDVL